MKAACRNQSAAIPDLRVRFSILIEVARKNLVTAPVVRRGLLPSTLDSNTKVNLRVFIYNVRERNFALFAVNIAPFLYFFMLCHSKKDA